MILKYFYDEDLAQASYLVGCPGSGDAIVIDPMRDIAPYLNVAKENGLTITSVAETHIHADYVSGGRELAHHTGATLYISGEGRDFLDGQLAYAMPEGENVQAVMDGDVIQVGGVRLQVIFSPGHTPEHIMFMLFDTNTDHPMGIFSGDCLFAGDIGRPDLLEEAAKVMNTKVIGAQGQFKNVQKLKAMPDYLQIWPGHGAGSACGKALGAVPSTTLGYEKLFNPAFQIDDEATFVDWLLADQPDAPRYFARMKAVNQVGAALIDTLPTPTRFKASALDSILETDSLVMDTRPTGIFAQGFVTGTINIPADARQFSTWAGWLVDFNTETYLIAESPDVLALLRRLRAVGVDNIVGYFPPSELTFSRMLPQITPEEAQALLDSGDALLLDVRWRNERAIDYAQGSFYIPLGDVAAHIDELPKDKIIITQCGGGVRSQIAASLLIKHGLEAVNLTGGMDAWRKANLAVERA
jgi:hydroxyacylglutathione hydrolase